MCVCEREIQVRVKHVSVCFRPQGYIYSTGMCVVFIFILKVNFKVFGLQVFSLLTVLRVKSHD